MRESLPHGWSRPLLPLILLVAGLAVAPSAATEALAGPPPGAEGQESRTPDPPADDAGREGQSDDGERQEEDRPRDTKLYERIMVVGDPFNVERIPGSAHYIGGEQLELAQAGYGDIHRILRRVPGVQIQEEEGYGLRPNIGLRGSGAERSSRITMMEDGVLIAPAPYASPSAYYFPSPGRMEAIEVRKGASQIKYGPRTTGGALNLVSTSVPSRLMVRGDVGYGSDATAKGHVAVGDRHRGFGWMLETYQLGTDGFKEIDGGDDAGVTLQDYVAKIDYRTSPAGSTFHQLELKAGFTQQDADETYLGLTEADFRTNPNRRYAGSQHDNFFSKHRQVQLRHFAALGDRVDLTNVAYRNEFERDWYKIGHVGGVGIGDVLADPARFAGELAILRGADSDPDALTQRHNNREYYSQGVQSVLGLRVDGDRVFHEIEVGLRYHEDEEDRLQSEDGYRMLNGQKVITSIGAIGSQANREAKASAWAAFAQDRIQFGDVAITPGLRFESVDLTRLDYSTADPDRSTGPTRIRDSGVDVLVPGVGIDYRIDDRLSAFGGIHRGFAPPGPGSDEETEPEKSVNYELGLRLRDGALQGQLVGFFTDYGNLLGADTLSSGGTGTLEQFNGGAVDVWGFEAGLSHDLANGTGGRLTVPVAVTYTYMRGEFQNSFASDFGAWGDVVAGDELPYLPNHQLYTSVGVRRDPWALSLGVNASSAMRTRAGRGEIPAGEGTDSYAVVDLTAEWSLGDRAVLHGTVQNLFDETYAVARRPAGARPGLPRTVMVGIRFHR